MNSIKVVLVAALFCACGGGDKAKECITSESSCDLEPGGQCVEYEPSGRKFCQYPDATCPSGFRWSPQAGDELSDGCVETVEPDAGTVDAGLEDAAPVDASSAADATNADGAVPPLTPLAVRFGGNGVVSPRAMVVDVAGNTYVVGSFSGSANFGDGNVIAQGSSALFVASYDVNGTHRWSVTAGSTSSAVAQAIGLDNSGSVIVAGDFGNTINLGGSDLVSAGALDVFIAKFSASTGAHDWSKRLPGAAGTDTVSGLVVENTGSFIVVGQYWGNPDFGVGALPAAVSWDVFLAKFDTSGNTLWSKGHGSSDVDNALGVALSSNGVIAVVGEFRGDNANFGGANLAHNNLSDVFVAAYSASNGAHSWSVGFGSTLNDIAKAVAFDGDDPVVTGMFNNTVDFGGGNMTSAGDDDIFVAKFAGVNGAHLSSERYGSTNNDSGTAISVVDGDTWVAGTFGVGAVNFGGGNLVNNDAQDIFLVQFNGAGAHVSSTLYGNTGFVYAADLWGQGGNIWLTGRFPGMLNFEGSILTASGTQDMYIVRLTP